MERGVSVGIQSPIPLIYLESEGESVHTRWDSVTYPLDILDRRHELLDIRLGFSHLSP